jgi:hypothetical protein
MPILAALAYHYRPKLGIMSVDFAFFNFLRFRRPVLCDESKHAVIPVGLGLHSFVDKQLGGVGPEGQNRLQALSSVVLILYLMND